MTWKVFGGKYYSIYLALLKQRCKQDGLSINAQALADQFRLHLHRGIGYLAADKNIKDLSFLLQNTATT